MFFENFAHGVVNSMNRPLTAPGDKLLVTEDLDQNRGLRCAPNGFGRLEVNLIIDLTAQYAKRFQIILPFANEMSSNDAQAPSSRKKSSFRSLPMVSSDQKSGSFEMQRYYILRARNG